MDFLADADVGKFPANLAAEHGKVEHRQEMPR
jgi:hypothetical protein